MESSLLFSDKKAPNAIPRVTSFIISQNVLKKLHERTLSKVVIGKPGDQLCVSDRIRCNVMRVLSLETRYLSEEKECLFESDVELLN
jgi:hypothetical protein